MKQKPRFVCGILGCGRVMFQQYTASSAEIDACGEIVRPAVLALKAVSLKQEPTSG
jgi:hypothetical protein